MALKYKLKKWLDNDIIDQEAFERIKAFESQNTGRLWFRNILWLGGFTISIGVISIVAANWDGIGAYFKLLAMLLSAGIFSISVWHLDQREKALARDLLIFVYFLFILAGIALIGQVYQLGTPLWQGLTAWLVAATPIVCLGGHAFLGLSWAVGLTITYSFVIQALEPMLSGEVERAVIIFMLGSYPIALFFLSLLKVFGNRIHDVLKGVRSAAVFLLVGAAYMLTCFWYFGHRARAEFGLVGPIGLIAVMILAILIYPKMRKQDPKKLIMAVQAFFLFNLLNFTILVFGSHSKSSLVAALTFIALSFLCGFISLGHGEGRLFKLFTALIAFRVLFIYFELFAGLLTTGLGLIIGGLLVIGIAWIWKTQSQKLAAFFQKEVAR